MTFKTNGASVIPAFFQNGKDVFFNADKLSDDQHFQAIQQRSLRYFDFVVVLCQLAQITMIGLAAFVYGTAQGGELNWTNAQLTNTQNAVNINFHALLLTTAILFCQGDGLLSLRLYRHEVKWVARVVNGLLHTLTLLLTAGGIAVIVVETNLGYQFSFSSQLSWLQLLIMIGQMVYTVVGVVCFWFPRCSPQVLGLVVPVQRAAGITLFLLNVGFLLAGIVEYKSALGE